MLRKSLLMLVVLGFVTPAFATLTIYVNDRAGYEADKAAHGCLDCCLEDFDSMAATVTGGLGCMFPPLEQGVPNNNDGQGFPNGLRCGMCLYSNYLDPTCDLVSLGTNFIGNHSTVVGPNYFAANLTADFCNCGGMCRDYGGYCAVGFDVIDGLGGSNATINAYDGACSLAASTAVRLPGPTTPMFIGIVATHGQKICKVEILCTSGELTDNWELCIPEPASLGLLALGGLVLLRRR